MKLKFDRLDARGITPKRILYDMEKGETRKFQNVTTSALLNCAKKQALARGNKTWKFSTYTENGYIIIVRTN